MIKLIETKNFRSLKYISEPLNRFLVLVGPNASGKTTFLDIVSFLTDTVSQGIDYAIYRRTQTFSELTFSGQGGDIELAIEVNLPKEIIEKLKDREFNAIRYELRFGLQATGEHAIKEEKVLLLKPGSLRLEEKDSSAQFFLFPHYPSDTPKSILNKKYKSKSFRAIVKKNEEGNDNFYSENQEKSGKGWMPSFKLGFKKSALGNLPADETKFPASTWLRTFLVEGVQLFILDSLNIRKASPPGQSPHFKTDGSNLPWVIDHFKTNEPERFKDWIAHIQTALPDIQDIEIKERADDRHKYLVIIYENNIRVPSWLASDGTLRLLALTLPAYLSNFQGVYLIEEPENGVHPKAIETVYLSLSSVYSAQILLATHSTVILSMVEAKEVLCFAKTPEGITDIVRGSEHPALRDWKHETNLSELFAGGVLG